MSKIHPKLELLIEMFAAFVGGSAPQHVEAWREAGKPVVEKEEASPRPMYLSSPERKQEEEPPPSIWDDKGTGKFGTMLDAKDARIEELERESKGALDLYKMAMSRADVLGQALNTSVKKITELEAKLAEATEEVKRRAEANCRMNERCQAEGSARIRAEKAATSWLVEEGKKVIHNAALDEAAKKFEDGVNWEWTFQAFHIAKVIRALKK